MCVARVVVHVVLVGVTLVLVMHVAGLVAVVLVGVALVVGVVVGLGVVLVGIALVLVMHVARFVAVVFVGIALVDGVFLQLTQTSLNDTPFSLTVWSDVKHLGPEVNPGTRLPDCLRGPLSGYPPRTP